MPADFVLTLSCADRPGIVAAVTTELAALNANISESNQFWDRETGTFFMRLAFSAPDSVTRDALERSLKPAIERFGMRTALVDAGRKKKILVMVSKFDHAMLHLLYQIRVGWLDAEVAAIVSNHEDSRATADYEGIPYHYLPVAKDKSNKQAQEQEVIRLRFGLDDGRQRTLDEVGKEFGLSRERIRQIEKITLHKLRHPSRARRLEAYAS